MELGLIPNPNGQTNFNQQPQTILLPQHGGGNGQQILLLQDQNQFRQPHQQQQQQQQYQIIQQPNGQQIVQAIQPQQQNRSNESLPPVTVLQAGGTQAPMLLPHLQPGAQVLHQNTSNSTQVISISSGNGQQQQLLLPEGAQLVRLPNGTMQIIQPTPVQQHPNQGLIFVSRSNSQVTKKIIKAPQHVPQQVTATTSTGTSQATLTTATSTVQATQGPVPVSHTQEPGDESEASMQLSNQVVAKTEQIEEIPPSDPAQQIRVEDIMMESRDQNDQLIDDLAQAQTLEQAVEQAVGTSVQDTISQQS
jgi:hypothetical protein